MQSQEWAISCIEKFRNLGQNNTCYYIVFDERKDNVYCVCGGFESEYTGGWKDFIFWLRLGEQQVFSTLQGGNRTFLKQLRGTDVFQHMLPISGALPPGGIK